MRLLIGRIGPLTPLLPAAAYVYGVRALALSEISGRLILVLASTVAAVLALRFWIDRQSTIDCSGRSSQQAPQSRACKESSIQTPPGAHLHLFARVVFSKRVFQLVIEPTLRNLLDEYCEALAEGRLTTARCVRIRGYWSFWSAVLAQIPVSITRLVVAVWKAIR